MTHVLAFLASGIAVVLAGSALARHADRIGEKTGLGRLWIGSLLLAGATSLPELATDLSAVRLGAADLAMGDLFGSSMANMLILALVDLLMPRRRVLQQAAFDHALAACLAISLNALGAAFVLARPSLTVLSVGPGSLLLLVAYLGGTRAVHLHARGAGASAEAAGAGRDDDREPMPSLGRSALRFAGAALVVLAAAPVFAWSARGVAAESGLGNTFVGTWMVGLATSLPELATSLAAVRLGAFDLAVGTLFGSNAFNMAIAFPLDLAQPGSLFASLDPRHALSGLFAVVLTSLGLAAIVYRARRRFGMLEPTSGLILVAYGVAIWFLYPR